MERVVKVAVANAQPLNCLILAIVLTNTTQGNSEAVIKLGVFDSHVCAVCLDGDTVVTVVDRPVAKTDVAGADSISAIGVGFIIY